MTVSKLKQFRDLPPPLNDALPLLATIVTYAVISTYFGHDALEQNWFNAVGYFRSLASQVLHLDSNDSLFVVGVWVCYITVYWGYTITITLLQRAFPTFFYEFKIESSEPLPTIAEMASMVPLVLFNQIFLAPPVLCSIVKLLQIRAGGLAAMDTLMTTLPSVGRFALCMVTHVLVLEIYFYCLHRALHSRLLYKRFHSIHHKYKAPCALESVYVHPVEYVLNSFTALVGPTFLATSPQLFTAMLTTCLFTFLQVHDHTGLWLPFLPKVLMHEYHHIAVKCNYGLVGLLDAVCGTSGKYDDFVRAKMLETVKKIE